MVDLATSRANVSLSPSPDSCRGRDDDYWPPPHRSVREYQLYLLDEKELAWPKAKYIKSVRVRSPLSSGQLAVSRPANVPATRPSPVLDILLTTLACILRVEQSNVLKLIRASLQRWRPCDCLCSSIERAGHAAKCPALSCSTGSIVATHNSTARRRRSAR
jgi:hypothetical protein